MNCSTHYDAPPFFKTYFFLKVKDACLLFHIPFYMSKLVPLLLFIGLMNICSRSLVLSRFSWLYSLTSIGKLVNLYYFILEKDVLLFIRNILQPL